MADTSVKYLHNMMPGAPVLSGVAGSLINVLDACLVNGFGVSAVASLVVAGGIATATISGGHSGEYGSVMLVAGATPSGLNGEKKVLSVGGGGTTLTFDAAGISDQTATGAITIKVAPAGWAKAFSGTNLAAYRSADVAATGCFLRIDDSVGKTARVVGYETMSGISTGSGPFPTVQQRSGGTWWTKSGQADATAVPWLVVADGRFFYLFMFYNKTYGGGGGAFMAFGDILPVKSGDAWSCVLSGYASDKSGSVPGDTNDYGVLRNSADELYLARSYTAVGSAAQAFKAFPLLLPSTVTGFASGNGPMAYPNGPDQGLYLTPHQVFEWPYSALRGVSPGLYCCPQNLPVGLFAPGRLIASADNLIGRDLRVMLFGASTATGAFAFFDTTGPWR
ncbi:hypothetical protein [Accumulibacter sp.]|uniref:hypothetical protein n=1 Tax=Accumulibacter sp. TaxID=2053492 RepID=UPI001AC27CB6|nr:hypothetical protein [Accumulibacter sp.]MBN8452274.1 hypothetical protein [Accumulibacter sp.]